MRAILTDARNGLLAMDARKVWGKFQMCATYIQDAVNLYKRWVLPASPHHALMRCRPTESVALNETFLLSAGSSAAAS